jgi:hypothetical protein
MEWNRYSALYGMMQNRPDNEAAQYKWLEYAGDLEWKLAELYGLSAEEVLKWRREIQEKREA